MKRMICLVTALLLCLSVACPVFASEDFVPSITYKDEPEIEWPVKIIDGDGEVIDEIDEEHLVITPISDAEADPDIPEDSREELLEVYEALTEGDMVLPGDEDLVIRDLFDISWICDDGHEEKLDEEGVCIEAVLDIGVDPNEDVVVMVYIDGEWVPAEDVIVNDDGTITVILENICPVVIAVPEKIYDVPAQTGDTSGIALWSVLMAISAGALVALLVFRRKVVR